jgi:hypothetical protein
MSENTSTENHTEDAGPQSLREALQESFYELRAVDSAEPESTESEPTEIEAQTSTSEEQEAFEEVPPEAEARGDDDEVIHAPEHWSAEDRETFNELPSAAKQYLLKREKQYEQGIQQKAEELKPLKEAFGPYRDILRMRGVDEATAVRTWVAAQQMLDTDPVNGFKMLIQQFGPDVQRAVAAQFGITEPDDSEGDDYRSDPEVRKLRQELLDLKRQNSQTTTQYQQLRQQEALEQVRQFREATGDDGKPLHPHFDEVADDMRALLSAGTVADLQAAYEKAVWSLPAYREEFAAKQRREAEREQARRREEAANKAKKTAKAVNGKGSVPPPPSKPKTLRDELAEAYKLSVRGEL